MTDYIDTADATAVPGDIKSGETAWARGQKLTGTQGFSIVGDTLIVPNDWAVSGDTLIVPDSWVKKD